MSHLPILLGVLATILIFAGAVLTTQMSNDALYSNCLLSAGVVSFLAGVLVLFWQDDETYTER